MVSVKSGSVDSLLHSSVRATMLDAGGVVKGMMCTLISLCVSLY